MSQQSINLSSVIDDIWFNLKHESLILKKNFQDSKEIISIKQKVSKICDFFGNDQIVCFIQSRTVIFLNDQSNFIQIVTCKNKKETEASFIPWSSLVQDGVNECIVSHIDGSIVRYKEGMKRNFLTNSETILSSEDADQLNMQFIVAMYKLNEKYPSTYVFIQSEQVILFKENPVSKKHQITSSPILSDPKARRFYSEINTLVEIHKDCSVQLLEIERGIQSKVIKLSRFDQKLINSLGMFISADLSYHNGVFHIFCLFSELSKGEIQLAYLELNNSGVDGDYKLIQIISMTSFHLDIIVDLYAYQKKSEKFTFDYVILYKSKIIAYRLLKENVSRKLEYELGELESSNDEYQFNKLHVQENNQDHSKTHILTLESTRNSKKHYLVAFAS